MWFIYFFTRGVSYDINASIMIDVNDITVRIGSKLLLERASVHISDGQKIGFVGANGCGKSTLFRVLKGEMETESGSVFFPNGYNVVFVEQEQQNIEIAILDFVLATDKERTELLERLETAPNEELGEIHDRLNMIGADSAPARAAAILNGLGFKHEDLSRPIKEFSGGWRMRLALAAALFQPSDVLLLDEPTNHLDLEASMWLESHLQKYRGTLVIISHDKTILNTLCNYIVHFDNGKLMTYSGNYDTFQRTRAMQRELLGKQAEKQEAHRKHLQSFVDRFRYKASKAKQAQSRIKMLEKLDTITLSEDPAATAFNFPEVEPLAPPMLTIEDGTVGYDGRPVLSKVNLQVVDNDRIALLGANGNGKSTLAKLISKRLALMEGVERRSSKLKVGYFAQHQAEELPLDLTATEFMSSLMPNLLEPKVRAHLARFGLSKEKALTQIEKLSGGEKARLLFAAMTYNAPQMLILDEPTNHLDIDGREALISALNEYQGSVILITHDIHLIELIADDLWLIKDGKCKPYDGDLEDYKRLLIDNKKAPKKESKKEQKVKQKLEEVKPEIRINRKEVSARLKRVEREIEKLHNDKTVLEKAFQTKLSSDEIANKQRELAWNSSAISEYEEEWLKLSAQFES